MDGGIGDYDYFWTGGGGDLSDWNINFGQSPECRSYAEAMSQGQFTFSDCGSSNTVIQTGGGLARYPLQIPPGVERYFSPSYSDTCCGNCSLDIPEVRLYYFPDKTTDCHHNQSSNATSTLPNRNLEKRIHSLIADGSTAMVSGHTFTSPSLYLQLMGTAAVHDRCTTVGPRLTNPIITLPPDGLSTWKPPVKDYQAYEDNFTIGEIWIDRSGQVDVPIEEGIAQLDVKDLACPTWGLGKTTSANGTVITTIGPPWLPLIVPPIEIFSLDPTWASLCTGVFSDQFDLSTFALFDPPIALTPATLLLPTPLTRSTRAPAPTPADPRTVPERATTSAEAAKPASLPKEPVAPPAKTGDPGKDSPTPLPVMTSAEPVSVPDSSTASPKNKGDPPSNAPSNPPSNPQIPSLAAAAGDPLADPIAPSYSAPDPQSGDSQKLSRGPKVPIVPVTQQGENHQMQAQGLGAIIYNAFGKLGPEVDGFQTRVNTISLPPKSIFTAGAQTFTVNPTGFKVNGAAISPGGTAQIVDGTTVSLDEWGVLAIDSRTISLANPSLTAPATPVLAVAGQTFTPNPSAFSIADTIISAGGPAITIDGTTISLGQSGALAIGSTTISLTAPSSTPFATKAYTVAGQTFTPNPSAFSIAGTTISADGPAVTISGTIISLGQNGALKIDSSTVSLPNPSDTLASKIYTVADQTFTPNPSTFSIAGTTVSAGGPALTVGGTIISLGHSGALAIGSSTIDLSTLTSTPSSEVYTVAGQIFTPNPLAFSIASTTISVGGPAATINGTIVSLQPSGTLVVGSSTIPLLTSQAALPSHVTIDGFDVKAQSSAVVIDAITISAAAAGVTISNKVISLEAGGATLDIGTGRFTLPTGTANSSVSVKAFMGGQSKGSELSLYLVCGVCGVLLLLMW